MSELRLDVHGVRASLRCDDEGVREALRRDFEYFEVERDGAPDVALELKRRPPEPFPLSPWSWRGPGYAAQTRGSVRRIRYEDDATAVYDYASRRGVVTCGHAERLHELGYLAALSRVGEELDRRGLHRAHALGFESGGRGGLLLLPSGGGKSTLALELLRAGRLRLLSDDTPIVAEDGGLRALPLRLGLRNGADLAGVPAACVRPFERRRHGPKMLVELDFFRERVAAAAAPRWLLVGSRRAGKARLWSASAAEAAAGLGLNLVVGWGVAQMSEYMLRGSPAGAAFLASIAARRTRAAAALVRRCEILRFELGDDPRRAAAALAELAQR